jgi:hypothetical protein
MGGIIVTQVGIFNRCACYTLWGRTGLALPENDSVDKTLFWRIDTSYPAIAFVCVGFQLVVVPYLLLRRYGLAVRVFLQRDDEKSNLPAWVVRFYGFVVVVWDVVKEGANKIRTGLGQVVMKLKGRRSCLIYTRGVAGEDTAPSTNRIGNNGQSEAYEEVELDDLMQGDSERQ